MLNPLTCLEPLAKPNPDQGFVQLPRTLTNVIGLVQFDVTWYSHSGLIIPHDEESCDLLWNKYSVSPTWAYILPQPAPSCQYSEFPELYRRTV